MPISRPSYQAGDVVIVPFPYADRLAEKRRPALVVNSRDLERLGFLWVLMITTSRQSSMARDCRVNDLEKAGLPADSVVRCAKIATIEPSRVLRKAGALNHDDLLSVFNGVRHFLADPSEGLST
jgi:mRNA interferase MazF